MLMLPRRLVPILVLAALLGPASFAPAQEDSSPFAGKYLAVHIRGRNFPIPFQDVKVRFLAEKCYLVGRVVPGILPKDRRSIGIVWMPLGDAAEIDEFESMAKLREFYNLAP